MLNTISQDLEYCKNAEMLADLRQIYPAKKLKSAFNFLADDTKIKIKNWLSELKQAQKFKHSVNLC